MAVTSRRFFGSHTTIQHQLQSAPVPLKKDDKRSLLDLSCGNRVDIVLHHVIQGFVTASFVPGVASTTLTVLAAENILPATLPVLFAPASTLAVFSLAGAMVGRRQALDQIKDEQEKVMQMNKELFILFNIAADRYNETQDQEDEDNALKIHYIFALDRIYEAIMLAETLKTNHSKFPSTMSVDSKYRDEKKFQDMRAVIEAYAAHRKQTNGRHEQDLWNTLKNQRKIFQCHDASPLEYLLKYNSAKQMEDTFSSEMKSNAKKYGKTLARFKKILNEIPANTLDSHTSYQLGELNRIISSIYHQDQCRIVMPAEENQKDKASEAYEKIQAHIPEKRRKGLQKDWKYLRSVLHKVDDYRRNGSLAICKNIVNSVNGIFGIQGSFRNFWRAPFHNDFSFDQIIERPGEELPKTTSLKMAFVSFTSLSSTGVSLYFTAITLGAVAMSATGFGLIVAAIALSLTILSVVCYQRSQQMQLHRDKQLAKFKATREALFNDEVKYITTEANKKPPLTQESESKDEARQSHRQRRRA